MLNNLGVVQEPGPLRGTSLLNKIWPSSEADGYDRGIMSAQNLGIRRTWKDGLTRGLAHCSRALATPIPFRWPP